MFNCYSDFVIFFFLNSFAWCFFMWICKNNRKLSLQQYYLVVVSFSVAAGSELALVPLSALDVGHHVGLQVFLEVSLLRELICCRFRTQTAWRRCAFWRGRGCSRCAWTLCCSCRTCKCRRWEVYRRVLGLWSLFGKESVWAARGWGLT